MKYVALVCLLLILLLSACEKKTEPVPVGQMSEYRDPGYGFTIQYPQEWKQLGTTGKGGVRKIAGSVESPDGSDGW